MTTACVCCDEKVEIRAMEEHLLSVHKAKLFHEGLKCAPCDTNFLFEPTRNPLQPYRYDNRSSKILKKSEISNALTEITREVFDQFLIQRQF